jgi:hypothetical protein
MLLTFHEFIEVFPGKQMRLIQIRKYEFRVAEIYRPPSTLLKYIVPHKRSSPMDNLLYFCLHF